MNCPKTFAAVVRSPATVRNAFQGKGIFQLWWACIRKLHGKPVHLNLPSTERRTIVAGGFKFYARLYECLALLLIGASCCIVLASLEHCSYWFGLLFLSGVYLLSACRLGHSGAEDYLAGRAPGIISLVIFFMMLTLFLAAFAAVSSLVIEQHGFCSAPLNLLALALLSAFGIGSYALELVYLLATKHHRE